MLTDVQVKRIKILLADEPSMWRDGLRALLTAQEDLDVVGDPSEGGSILGQTLKHRPDLVICDSGIGDSAVSELQELRDRGIQIRVILFSTPDETGLLRNPLRRGIAAVVPKNSPTQILLSSIRRVISGEVPTDLSLQPLIPPKKPGPLSRRERQLVGLIALGFRNREIADKLVISEQTVKNHLHHVFEKVGIKDRLELALYAIYHGLYE